MGWPCDYNRAMQKLISKYSLQEANQIREMVVGFAGKLDKKIRRYKVEIPRVGDDGYSDLLRHIVGLGKEEYYKHLKNLQLVVQRAKNDDYCECFTYCFPSESDYEIANPNTGKKKFQEQTKGILATLNKLKELDTQHNIYYRPVFNITIASLHYILGGKFDEFITFWRVNNVESELKTFMKWYHENENELPHKLYEFFHNEFQEHSIYNLHNDILEAVEVWEKQKCSIRMPSYHLHKLSSRGKRNPK